MAAAFSASSPPSPPPPSFSAEDDFGDFEFVLPPTTPPTLHPHYEDDEWGDFVESANPPPTQPKVWEKPTGALPLSIFGEEEEEEEEERDLENSAEKGTKGLTFAKNSPVGDGNGGVRDLFADLYGDSRKDDVNGWEFKDAESDLFRAGGAGVQVIANGVEHVQEQSILFGECNGRQENGEANGLFDPFSHSTSQIDPLSVMKNKIGDLNLENSLNTNSTSVSISSPAKDVFHFSTPSKGDFGLVLPGTCNEDLISEVKIDGNVTYDDDDLDDNDWEFKDASTDMWNEHHVPVEVFEKGRENICSVVESVNEKKDGGVSCGDDGKMSKVPGLFIDAVSQVDPLVTNHGVERKNEYAMDPTLMIPTDTPSTTDVPLSFSIPSRSRMLDAKSGNIRDLLDVLYGQANECGLDGTASQGNAENFDSDINHFGNDDLDDSSWEFKQAVPDMHDGGSDSLRDQNNFMVSSVSVAASANQESRSNLSSTVSLADSYPKITRENGSASSGDFLFGGADQSISGDQSIEISFPKTGISNESTDRNKVTTRLEPEVFIDFYTELRNMSHLLVLKHLDDLKKAHEIAKLSGEDDITVEIQQKIQAVCVNLHDVDFSENISTDRLSMDLPIENLLERLQQPYLQALEIEYLLSEKILLAKKNVTSAFHLLKHTTLILWLLKAASYDDQTAYVIAWYKMISVCTQELQNGNMIWTRCLQADIHTQILSQVEGLRYFLALGEIFRVVEILNVTSRMYKPWLLLHPVESNRMQTEIRECSKFWTSSGLEKALESIQDLSDSGGKEKIRSLLNSINSIHEFGDNDLLNDIPSHSDSVCRLSLLPLEKLQGMETVVWSGKSYFLKLANLWANRISNESPSLPCINVG